MTIDITTLTDHELNELRKAAYCDLHFCMTGIRQGFSSTCGESLTARTLRNSGMIRAIDRELSRRVLCHA